MLRKTILSLAAVAALGAAALAPTSASAHGWKFGGPHFVGGGFGYGYPGYFAPPMNCYFVKRWTVFGPEFVKVCRSFY